jgi:hypothetical protein
MPASKGGKLKVDPAGCGGSSVHVRVDEVRSCGACNVVLAKGNAQAAERGGRCLAGAARSR